MARISKKDQPPRAVQLIRAELGNVMALDDPNDPGYRIGDAVGVYAYFDYDDEPIYVGQTSSSFRDRISRHLTGQRSDAVAKFILDPFEVASVAMWSLPNVAEAESLKRPGQMAGAAEKKFLLNPYEYTVYKTLEARSKFRAVLNEGVIHPTALVELPPVVHARIIPDALWEERKHSDVRIARRAATISRLSQMISEREVSGGMRRTLLLQAQRLTWLAEQRIHEVGVELPDAEDATIGDE
ncbi:GIY-YIG nuclease family protein [Micromonospora fulviviridis]|uniref:GIY-YIG nuclease family protein n=1 Tax=Micromonospora fulviviridis TaxID=47860 RepID=A0ABV2VSX4_9ACTN